MATVKQLGSSAGTPNYRKASVVELVLGSANNGVSICFYMLAMMASYIASSGYGIATALVGVLLTGTRIFDGVTDGLISAIFDKVNVSKGKIRIFLLGGWVVEALGVILMYHWGVGKFSGVAGVVAFVAFYSLYIIGYTMNGVGGGVAQIVLTNDPKQRPPWLALSARCTPTLCRWFCPRSARSSFCPASATSTTPRCCR